jgi:zinc transporter
MLDDIEETMLDDDTPDDPKARSKLATIRRQAITYRRHLVPQRDAMLSLLTIDATMFDATDQAVLRVASEQVARVVEALEEVRDRAAVTAEEIRARHEARISRTLYLLTIVATIALPLGLITGLFGINVGGMPWLESGLGFGIVCGVMVVIAAVEFVVFKVMRWV